MTTDTSVNAVLGDWIGHQVFHGKIPVIFRSDSNRKLRWHDPTTLNWLTFPPYLQHP